MTDLAVREMVLYKHGVGFFVRQGEFEGTEATLNFRADEVNDILKSLAVFDRTGGKVYGVHYQTPMDRAHRLANTSIRLGNETSITQLFQQLRGRQVTLLVDDGKGKPMPYTGRVIGTEKQHTAESGEKWFVSLLMGDGATHIFPFARIRQFSIKDEQSKADLAYFLDTSMKEDNRRSVVVRMSEGSHDLVVQYVAPSPTWRVSYRLVAEADGEDTGTGKALLQGWGLFDNRFEEDLNGVKVTLVAGQPISFIYDLYESKIPDRPVVKDEARVVEAPVEYQTEIRRARAKSAPAPAMRMAAQDSFGASQGIYPSADEREEMAAYMVEQTAGATETRASGETFQYIVTTPVTVKRGESALVPILGETMNYERELLYNKDKHADHPVAALRFENQTGLTLERGPVTVVEDGDYRGEAIIPFTKDKNAVYVPYAVELGVKVKENHRKTSELHGISINREYLRYQFYDFYRRTYTIENSTDSEKVVTVEAPKRDHFDLFETREPDAETLNERRWKVDAPAGETVDFVLKERHLRWESKVIRRVTYQDLDRFLENRYIDDAIIDALRDIVDAVQAIDDMNRRIEKLEQERQSLYDKQDQLRKNMSALGSAGKEGTLRQRVVNQLEASQDRLETIDTEIADHKSAIIETEQKITDLIAALGESYAEG